MKYSAKYMHFWYSVHASTYVRNNRWLTDLFEMEARTYEH